MVRKAKAHLELNVARDAKGNKKGFCKYLCGKRKTREIVGPQLNGAGALVTQDMGKAEVLNAFFTSKTSLQESKTPEAAGKVWSKEDTPFVEEDRVRECLSKLDLCKSMGLDGMHSCMLRELADVIARHILYNL